MKIWDAQRQGFKIAEKVWNIISDGGQWDGLIALERLIVRNSRNYSFAFDDHGNLKHDGVVEGVASTGVQINPEIRRLPVRKFVIYSYNPLDDDGQSIYGNSDFRCIWRYFYGNLATHKVKLRAGETFARPPVLLKFPRDEYKKSDRTDIVKNVNGLYGRLVTSVPGDVTHHLIETARGDSGATSELLKYQGDQIARGMLLGPMLQGSQERGVSVKNVQFETFMFLLDWIGKDTEEMVNHQIIEPLMNMNFDTTLMPRFRMPSMARNKGMMAEFVRNLVESGVISPAEEWVREMLDLPAQRTEFADGEIDDEDGDLPDDPEGDPGGGDPDDLSEKRRILLTLKLGELHLAEGENSLSKKISDKNVYLISEQDNGHTSLIQREFESELGASNIAKAIIKRRRDVKVRMARRVGTTKAGLQVFEVIRQFSNLVDDGPHNVRDYAVVTASYWAFTLTDGALRMLVLLHLHERGFSPATIASMFLFYEFFGVVTNFVGGWLGARFGLKATLFAGLLLQIVACSMLTLEPARLAVAWLMGAQALSGIAKDLTKMSSKSYIKLVVPDGDRRGLLKWVAILTGSKNTLKGVGFFLGGVLLGGVGLRDACFGMAGALSIVLLAATLLLPAAPGKSATRVRARDLVSRDARINWLSAARLFLFGSRDVWFVLAVPLFLRSEAGWSHTGVGGFLALWIIGYGIVQAFAPTFVRRPDASGLSRWTAALVLPLLAILLGLELASAPTEILVVGLAAFGVVFAATSAVHSYLIVSYAARDEVALRVGFYYMANAAGRLVGTLLSGLVFQLAGEGRGGLIACLATSIGLVVAASAACQPLRRAELRSDHDGV